MVVIAAVAAGWVIAAASHSAGLPRTDDWAWARVGLRLYRTGHVRLVGWGPMTMLGLVAWAQPFLAVFGPHVWALDLSVSVLVAAGLLAASRLARLVAGTRAAVVVVATIAVLPGFVRDAATFMTDAPAFALGTVTLLAGIEAAEADGWRRRVLEAACLACGLWAFTVRELAAAAPVAVLVVRWVGERGRRRVLGAQAGLLAAGSIAFWVWRSSLAGGQPYGGRPPVFTISALLVGVVFTTSLLLVPALAATAPNWWRARHRAGRAVGIAVGAALALVPLAYEPGSWAHRYQWLTGDYLDPRGVNGNKLLLGSRPRVLPAPGWVFVEAAGVVAGLVVAGLVVEAFVCWWRSGGARRTTRPPVPTAAPVETARGSIARLGRRVLTAHAALTLTFVAVAIVRNGAVYDRYLWPLVLSGAVLLVAAFPVRPFVEWHPAASQAALSVVTAFAIVTVLLTLNSDAFDGARWRAASAAGARATAVDGGFEWVGWHATGVADVNAYGDGTRPYWVVMVGEQAACAELSASPLSDAGLVLARVVHWRTWLVFGRARLYEYRRPSACAAAPRPQPPG